MISGGAQCLTLDVVTIFGNQIWLFLCDSSRITIELNLFHGIQDGYACITYGIHVEFIWNSHGMDHSMTIPYEFHMESMMSWNKKLAGVSANIHSMDSIQNNPGKVKTSIAGQQALINGFLYPDPQILSLHWINLVTI